MRPTTGWTLRKALMNSNYFYFPCLQGGENGFWRRVSTSPYVSAPAHCQKHLLKMKEILAKHLFKPITNKLMVVLRFILGSYLGKTAAIYRSALKWMATSGNNPWRFKSTSHCWSWAKLYWRNSNPLTIFLISASRPGWCCGSWSTWAVGAVVSGGNG